MFNPSSSPSATHPLWAQLPLPLWVLRPVRELVYANPAAAELHARGQVDISGGRLMHVGSLAAPALETLLRWSLTGTAQPTALWLASAQHENQHTGWLQATPLAPSLARASGWPEEILLLCLHLDHPELAQRARLDALCERVSLSPAERCVLLLLADGLVPEAVAGRLDIRLSTARAHVRHLLAKTHAPSLAQLLRWVGSAEALPG